MNYNKGREKEYMCICVRICVDEWRKRKEENERNRMIN